MTMAAWLVQGTLTTRRRPLSLSRRDVFAMAIGEITLMWQRKIGIERPAIDLYVDVSGSMRKYYPLIPYIYSGLKQAMGKVYQFSTQVLEVDLAEAFLLTTGGTDFLAVGRHMLENNVRSAILLSDGLGELSGADIESLQAQLEQFIYLKVKANDYRNWEDLATETIILTGRPEGHYP